MDNSMDNSNEVYSLESLEQLRAIADPLRVRILEAVETRAMTAKQLADHLKEVASKVHYHVRELERVGLLRLVETREKGGVLEKYYRIVAPNIVVPQTLLSGLPPDETVAAFGDVLQILTGEFLRAVAFVHREDSPVPSPANLLGTGVWLTPDEYADISRQVAALLDRYRKRRGIEGERERMMLLLSYDAAAARADAAPSAAARSEPPATAQMSAPASRASGPSGDGGGEPKPKRLRVVVAGTLTYSREDLERAVARGEAHDIHVAGRCRFAPDIPAELVEHAVARFRHRGVLEASPEVRAVLARKREEASGRA